MHGGFFPALLGLVLLAVPSLLAPSILRIRGVAAYALSGLITAAAVVVALATALSLVGSHLTLGWMLAGETLTLGTAYALGRLARCHPLCEGGFDPVR